MLVHGLTNKPSNNSPSDKEIEFIKNFKNKYPIISITQFQDIYHEDVIWNSKTWIFIWISVFKQKAAISLTILPKLNISIDFLILTVIIIVKFICIRHDVIGFFA